MNIPPKYCTGCASCMNICSQRCIQMIEDEEGFVYPQIDEAKCIRCGACERVCAVIHQKCSRNPVKVYVAKNTNEKVRMESSSGGIFTSIAEQILSEGGIVFGAKFNEQWEVVHDYTETIEGLAAFRGSKYVQSRIGNTYQQARFFLNKGRKVLFTGTPCQILGLKNFLGREYENLLTVDFVCHGVPSLKVWRHYLRDVLSCREEKKDLTLSYQNSKEVIMEKIEFRSKSTGWKNYSFALTFKERIANGKQDLVVFSSIAWENSFMKGFLSDLYLRPSCYHCFVKGFRSQSEMTIADAWGIEHYLPQWNDDKGASLLCMFNEKSIAMLADSLQLVCMTVDDSVIGKYNRSAFVCPKKSRKRKIFFRLMKKGEFSFYVIIDKCLPPSTYWDKLIWSVNKRIKRYVK